MILLFEYLSVYIIGAASYGAMEILFRGFTHWSMLLTGGACLTTIYIICNNCRLYFWQECVLGAMIITTFEFLVGSIVNLSLGWSVWDYSNSPFHLMGQICLPFSIVWLFVCIPATKLCHSLKDVLRRQIVQ